MTEANGRVATVVLTALDVEYRAVRAYLRDLRTQTHPAGTIFETGVVQGTTVRVALALVGEGNRAAAVVVERANTLFRPDALFFVGVAGALHSDLELGDVVVATRMYAYHGGKEESADFLSRPRAWDAPHHLEQLARRLARTTWWEQLLPQHTGYEPFKTYFRPIAAGDIVLNSPAGQSAQVIRQRYNDAAAVEMEGAGAAEAAHLNRSLPLLTIRGVSDRADGSKLASDAAGWQRTAASHAAAFALALAVYPAAGSEPRNHAVPAFGLRGSHRNPIALTGVGVLAGLAAVVLLVTTDSWLWVLVAAMLSTIAGMLGLGRLTERPVLTVLIALVIATSSAVAGLEFGHSRTGGTDPDAETPSTRPGSGGVLHNAVVSLHNEEYLDAESGTIGTGPPQGSDLGILSGDLWPVQRKRIARATGKPDLAACVTILAARDDGLVQVSELHPGEWACMVTVEGNTMAIEFRTIPLDDSPLVIAYTVWQK